MFRGQHARALSRSLSIFGIAAAILGGALLAGRGDRVEASPAPSPSPSPLRASVPCPVTWQVFSTTAVLIEELTVQECPNRGGWPPLFGKIGGGVSDLDGDGVAEVLSDDSTGKGVLLAALRYIGGTPRIDTIFGGQPLDIPFANPDDELDVVEFADMTGDGLPDLIVIA